MNRPRKRRKSQRFSPLTLLVIAAISVISWITTNDKPSPAVVPASAENVIAQVQVLDVGQGSSMLLRTEANDSHAVLIDGGERSASQAVCDALDAAGITHLDLMIMTHPHTDHFGGLITVLENYTVDALWMPVVPEKLIPTNKSYTLLLDAIEANGCDIVFPVSPRTETIGDDATLQLLDAFLADPDNLNDTSLCLRIDVGQASILVTGDGESAVEKALLENRAPVAADIFVAGHHGSNTSNKQSFLNTVSPEASIISCGKDNSYHLPNQDAVTRLSAFGPIYRTDLNGTVTLSTDGNTIWVAADNINDAINAKEAA